MISCSGTFEENFCFEESSASLKKSTTFHLNTNKCLTKASIQRGLLTATEKSYGSLSSKDTVKRATKKAATCFATLLQNELNSDVARLPTKNTLATLFVPRKVRTWVANAQRRSPAMLQNKLHVLLKLKRVCTQICFVQFCISMDNMAMLNVKHLFEM